jgi:hypothetical protein
LPLYRLPVVLTGACASNHLPRSVRQVLSAPSQTSRSSVGRDTPPQPGFSRRLSDRHSLDYTALENIDRINDVALGTTMIGSGEFRTDAGAASLPPSSPSRRELPPVVCSLSCKAYGP